MEYTALYRHWRPKGFEEVVGQEPIVRTLKNQIVNNRIVHAYLFCGPRGTGKTTTAKIFANAINCMTPEDGSPCKRCDVCKKFSSGNNMDIIEIDAASNNGIEEIRSLRDKVKFPPAFGRYKVYIIDEVHMLSTAAFNGFLKTLEEPPSHVVFILATTEPYRLPATILSRCQRFDFKRITVNVIVDRLKVIAKEMGFEVEASALATIARWAEGGMRDAISLLDQCVGFCGNSITYDNVLSVLGTADQGFVFSMAQNILEGKRHSLLLQVDQLFEEGRDLAAFLRDIINHFRNLLIVKTCDSPEQLLDVSLDTIQEYRTQAGTASEERLIRTVEALSSLESDLKWNTKPRILLELALIKICRPEHEDSMEALLERIKALEDRLENGVIVTRESKALSEDKSEGNLEFNTPSQQQINGENPVSSMEAKSPRRNSSARNDLKDQGNDSGIEDQSSRQEKKDVVSAWPEVLKLIKKERVSIYGFLMNSKVRMGKDQVLTVIFSPKEGFYVEAVEKEDNRKFIEEIVLKVTGQTVKLKCILEDEGFAGTKDVENIDIVQKAIEIFGKEFVEVVEDESDALETFIK